MTVAKANPESLELKDAPLKDTSLDIDPLEKLEAEQEQSAEDASSDFAPDTVKTSKDTSPKDEQMLDFIPQDIDLSRDYREARQKEDFRVKAADALAKLEADFPDKSEPQKNVTAQEISASNRAGFLRDEGAREEEGTTLGQKALAVGKDIAGGLVRLPSEVIGGATEAANEILGLIDKAGHALNELTGLPETKFKIKIPEIFKTPEGAKTVTGDIIRNISKFSVGLKGVNVALKAFKVGAATGGVAKVAEAAAKFGAADALVFSEHEKRLSNIIESFPALQNPITEYLKAEEDDSFAEAKFKQFVEGTLTGVAAETLIKSVKAFRSIKSLKDKSVDTKLVETAESKAQTIARREAAEKEAIKKGAEILGDIGDTALFKKNVLKKTTEEFKKGKITPEEFKKGIESSGDPSKEFTINYNNINGPQDIKDLMAGLAADSRVKRITNEIKRGVRTNIETYNAALKLNGFDLVLGRGVGQAFNAEQITAARIAHTNVFTTFRETIDIASKPFPTVIEIANWRKMLAVSEWINAELKGVSTESGRASQAWRIKVGPNEQSIKNLQSVVDEFGGFKANHDLAIKMASRMKDLTAEQLTTFVEKGKLAKTVDAMNEAFAMSLLSSTDTQVKNFSSSFVNALLEIPKSFIGSLIKDSPILKRESLYMVYGMGASLKEGLHQGASAFKAGRISKGGKIPEGTRIKWDLPEQRNTSKENLESVGLFKPIAYGIDYYCRGLQTVALRTMAAIDEGSKFVFEKMKSYSLAARRADEKGLKGDDVNKFIAEYVRNPPKSDLSTIQDFAKSSLFFTELGSFGKTGQKLLSKVPILKLRFPFVRTSINIAKNTFEHSPLAFTSSNVRSAIAAGGEQRAEALARIGLGSTIISTFVDLSMEGHVTGAPPADRNERNILLASGWRPYSVRVGDSYIPYRGWGPISSMLGWSADTATILFNYRSYDKEAQNDVDELVTGISLGMNNNVIDQIYLGSLTSLLDVFKDPAGKGKAEFRNFAASWVPAILRQAARATDPDQKNVQNMVDAFKAKTPYFSKQVPKHLDIWGKPMATYRPSFDGMKGVVGGVVKTISAFANPLYMSDAVDSQLNQYLLDNGFPVNMPSMRQNFDGSMIDLREHPEQFENLLKLRGSIKLEKYNNQTMQDYITSLVKGGTEKSERFFSIYKNKDDQMNMIRSVVSDYQNAAKAQILDESEAIREKIQQNKLSEIKSATRLIER